MAIPPLSRGGSCGAANNKTKSKLRGIVIVISISCCNAHPKANHHHQFLHSLTVALLERSVGVDIAVSAADTVNTIHYNIYLNTFYRRNCEVVIPYTIHALQLIIAEVSTVAFSLRSQSSSAQSVSPQIDA